MLRLPMMPKTLLTSAALFATLSIPHPARALEWALNKEQSRITFEMVAPDGSLTGQFEQFEAEINALHHEMAEPAFYQQPGNRIAVENARLKSLEEHLAAAYERWELLDTLER